MICLLFFDAGFYFEHLLLLLSLILRSPLTHVVKSFYDTISSSLPPLPLFCWMDDDEPLALRRPCLPLLSSALLHAEADADMHFLLLFIRIVFVGGLRLDE